jgi:uncharacterized membrane protein YhaH (DUF805 family)
MSGSLGRSARANFWWWFTPLVLTLALLVYLAWKQAGAASNPFTYDLG